MDRNLPLRPSLAASVTRYLCMAIADVVEHEMSGSQIDRRTYLKLYGLGQAAEIFADQAAVFHGGLQGEDQSVLDELEEKYVLELAGSDRKYQGR